MNPNVFYELAIRHAIRKPLVQLIQKGERIPFDVAGTRTIHVDHQDLDSAAAARDEIIGQIKQIEAAPDNIETPISVSLDLQILRQSENPEDRSLAEIVSEIAEIKSITAKLVEGMDSKEFAGLSLAVRRLEHYVVEGRTGRTLLVDKRSARYLFDFVESAAFANSESPALAIAIISSLFIDSAPWLHSVGMEAYRQLSTGPSKKAETAVRNFQMLAEMTLHHPAFKAMTRDRDREEYFFLRELLERVISRLPSTLG